MVLILTFVLTLITYLLGNEVAVISVKALTRLFSGTTDPTAIAFELKAIIFVLALCIVMGAVKLFIETIGVSLIDYVTERFE